MKAASCFHLYSEEEALLDCCSSVMLNLSDSPVYFHVGVPLCTSASLCLDLLKELYEMDRNYRVVVLAVLVMAGGQEPEEHRVGPGDCS
mmetsp:Transcript_6550/g.8372  ORF Transcript_6550/g.8372 Transcript_6550/m.8372 type:complete len:89 (-) Transcript_6550:152-418(-)